MKLIMPLVIAFSVICAQAKPLDEMIKLITESDLTGFNACSCQNTFAREELVAFKNLNESVLDKRKTGWSLNHKKAMLDGYQELLLGGMILGIVGGKISKKCRLEKSREGFSGTFVFCGVLACVGLYCAVKFVISNLRKREKFELLYKDAILINTALEILINQTVHDNQSRLQA